jgi:hypothetical protein
VQFYEKKIKLTPLNKYDTYVNKSDNESEPDNESESDNKSEPDNESDHDDKIPNALNNEQIIELIENNNLKIKKITKKNIKLIKLLNIT